MILIPFFIRTKNTDKQDRNFYSSGVNLLRLEENYFLSFSCVYQNMFLLILNEIILKYMFALYVLTILRNNLAKPIDLLIY